MLIFNHILVTVSEIILIVDCHFEGGGPEDILAIKSNITLLRSRFSGNGTTGSLGAALLLSNSTAEVLSCVFENNVERRAVTTITSTVLFSGSRFI